MRLFYGMIDSATLNEFVIFTENVPNFGEHKKDKRQQFFKELALALIIPANSARCETGHSQLRSTFLQWGQIDPIVLFT
jgi:hypothetical protein